MTNANEAVAYTLIATYAEAVTSRITDKLLDPKNVANIEDACVAFFDSERSLDNIDAATEAQWLTLAL